MAANSDNPFTQEDLAAINHVLELVARHKDLLAKCQRCGLPVEDHVARMETDGRLAEALKTEFFPEAV